MTCQKQLELWLWMRYRDTDARSTEAPHSIGVWSLKTIKVSIFLRVLANNNLLANKLLSLLNATVLINYCLDTMINS